MTEPPPSGAPAASPPGTSPRRRRLVAWLVVALLAVLDVAVLVFMGVLYGLDALLVGTVASVVLVPVLILALVWLGRYEPPPVRFLAFSFAWGAFAAVALALAVNTGAAWVIERLGGPELLVAVTVAPVIEEIGKAAAPALLWWRRRAVTGITTAVVYAGLSAVGFAMVENILYIGGIGYRSGVEEFGPATGVWLALGVFAVRILLSAFAHPLFTTATAFGIGIAVGTRSRARRWLAVLVGLFVAMLLHATWNGAAVLTTETGEMLILLYGYLGLMVPLFLAGVGIAIAVRAREGQVTQRVLPEYARAGWLTPPEIASLRDPASRFCARRWARRVAGEAGAQAMARFQTAAVRLAQLREAVRRGAVHGRRLPPDEEERALLAELVACREVFTGRDPQTPPAWWDGTHYHLVFPDGSTRTVAPPPEPVVPVPLVLATPPGGRAPGRAA